MSHPDTRHDPENERADDDLRLYDEETKYKQREEWLEWIAQIKKSQELPEEVNEHR